MTPRLRITFLGTGTSVGIPVITCRCAVCTSADPRNRRLRAGLLLEWPAETSDGWAHVLVDTTTDLRQQALRAGIERVDAVLYTHAHADHVLGLDELRIYNFVHRTSIPLYGDPETLDCIRKMFAYAFDPDAVAVPRLRLCPVTEPEVELLGRRVQALPVMHGPGRTLALRLGGFAYCTDCNGIPEETAERLEGLQLLVIDALRRKPHRSHFSVEQALGQIERLRPRRALLTHLSHELDHAELERELPDGVGVAYDGMVIELPADAEPVA